MEELTKSSKSAAAASKVNLLQWMGQDQNTAADQAVGGLAGWDDGVNRASCRQMDLAAAACSTTKIKRNKVQCKTPSPLDKKGYFGRLLFYSKQSFLFSSFQFPCADHQAIHSINIYDANGKQPWMKARSEWRDSLTVTSQSDKNGTNYMIP